MSSTAGNPFGTLYGGPLHQQPTSASNQGANSSIPPPLGNLRSLLKSGKSQHYQYFKNSFDIFLLIETIHIRESTLIFLRNGIITKSWESRK